MSELRRLGSSLCLLSLIFHHIHPVGVPALAPITPPTSDPSRMSHEVILSLIGRQGSNLAWSPRLVGGTGYPTSGRARASGKIKSIERNAELGKDLFLGPGLLQYITGSRGCRRWEVNMSALSQALHLHLEGSVCCPPTHPYIVHPSNQHLPIYGRQNNGPQKMPTF